MGDNLSDHFEANSAHFIDEEEVSKPCLGIVFIPCTDGLKIPLLERSKGEDEWWDFPGGKRRLTEHPFDCIKREMLEEVGIVVSAHACVDSKPQPHPKFGNEKARSFIFCNYISGAPTNKLPDEHKSMKLCSPDDAIERLKRTGRIPDEVVDFIRSYVATQRFLTFPDRDLLPR